MNYEMPKPQIGETVLYEKPGDKPLPFYVFSVGPRHISGVVFVPQQRYPVGLTAIRHKEDPDKSPNDPSGVWFFLAGRNVPTTQIVEELTKLSQRFDALELRVTELETAHKATKTEAEEEFKAIDKDLAKLKSDVGVLAGISKEDAKKGRS